MFTECFTTLRFQGVYLLFEAISYNAYTLFGKIKFMQKTTLLCIMSFRLDAFRRRITSFHVFFYTLSSSLQLIQTISAVDTDEPLVGHKFVFSISPTNPNFTIVDREGNMDFYYNPQIIISILSFLMSRIVCNI